MPINRLALFFEPSVVAPSLVYPFAPEEVKPRGLPLNSVEESSSRLQQSSLYTMEGERVDIASLPSGEESSLQATAGCHL